MFVACFGEHRVILYYCSVYVEDEVVLVTEIVSYRSFLRFYGAVVYQFGCGCGYYDGSVLGYSLGRLRKDCYPYLEWLVLLYLLNAVREESLM